MPGYKHGLIIQHDSHKHRVIISGTWERDMTNYQYIPSQYDIKDAGLNVASSMTGEIIPEFAYLSSITASDKKTAAQILKDIENRFLPGYYKLYEHMMKRIEGSNQYLMASQNSRDKLAEVFKGCKSNTIGEHDFDVWSHKHNTDGKFHASNQNINIKISCDMETALQIAEILKKSIDKENKS